MERIERLPHGGVVAGFIVADQPFLVGEFVHIRRNALQVRFGVPRETGQKHAPDPAASIIERIDDALRP